MPATRSFCWEAAIYANVCSVAIRAAQPTNMSGLAIGVSDETVVSAHTRSYRTRDALRIVGEFEG